MMRHIAIALAAAVIIGGSIVGASARGGGHGGGGHMASGGGPMSFSHGGPMSFSHAGSFSTFSGARPWSGNRAVFGNRFVGHRFGFRRRFHRRFFFVGGPFYGYDDDCYARIWTRWGWRWHYVCY